MYADDLVLDAERKKVMILSAGDGIMSSVCGYVQFAEKGVGNNCFVHNTHRFTCRYT